MDPLGAWVHVTLYEGDILFILLLMPSGSIFIFAISLYLSGLPQLVYFIYSFPKHPNMSILFTYSLMPSASIYIADAIIVQGR